MNYKPVIVLLLVMSFSACAPVKKALLTAGLIKEEVAADKPQPSEAADVDEKDVYGKTALLKAAEQGDLATVRALLEKGADVNYKTDQGGTALQGAAYAGHIAVVDALLSKGAEVNAKDIFGTTALMAAASYGHNETVQALLDKGADATIKTKSGNTALKLALKGKHREVVILFGGSVDEILYSPLTGGTGAGDTSPPVIEVTTPQIATRGLGGVTGVVKDSQLLLKGVARDESKIAWVTINDKYANLSGDGGFSQKVTLGAGDNRILVVAMDVAGNAGRKEIIINREKGIAVPSKDILTLSGNYHALIIGNNNYRDLPKLKTARYDAGEINKILKEKYGFKTKLLLDATRSDIMGALNGYRKVLKENDNFLLYYAGHGEFDKVAQEAYWLPVDALSDDDTNWIIVDNITANIKRIASKHVLVVADSCFSGTFTRKAITNLSIGQAKRRYLQKMSDKSSRTLMASGGNEPVSDIGGGKHSVFADAFIQGLLDVEEEMFTAEEFYYDYIKERVAGNAQQTPEYNPIRKSGHNGGDFIFKKIE